MSLLNMTIIDLLETRARNRLVALHAPAHRLGILRLGLQTTQGSLELKFLRA